MNSDTIRDIEQTKRNGYYKMSMWLGEGGWNEIHKFASDWGTYVLEIDGEVAEKIKAKNDGVALNAFDNLYRLDECEYYEIYEKIVSFRTIGGNI